MNDNVDFNSVFPDFEKFVSSFNKDDNSNNNNFDSSNFFDSNNSENNFFGNIDINTILKMKQIINNANKKSDPRSTLLLSLKPYLKPSRRQKIDQYIQFFNISDIIENLKPIGGENTK